MDAHAAARTWVDAWRRAWPAADPEPLAAVYDDDAVFYSHPFRPRQSWRAYAEWAFSDQAEAECRFGDPLVEGDRAAVDWCGVIRAKDGSVETVAGTSLLRFGADGRVVEQRDAWGSEPGRHELPDWAR
jgi:ketosteroid isomerase-like protein